MGNFTKSSIIVLIPIFSIVILALWVATMVKEPYLNAEELAETNFYSDVEDAYVRFTSYMMKNVDYRLNGMDCQPEKYYYDNSTIYFSCGDAYARFGYGFVTVRGEDMMNPKGNIGLDGTYDKETELAFYSFGVSKILNCVCDEQCICEGGILAEMDEYGPVLFDFADVANIEDEINGISIQAGFGSCEFTDDTGEVKFSTSKIIRFSCEKIRGYIIKDEVQFVI